MKSIPDWLVERAALDEVPAASRDRIDRADPGELADRIAALRDDNDAELARNPARPAVAQIEARVAREARHRAGERRRHLQWLGVATAGAAAVVLVVGLIGHRAPDDRVAIAPRAGGAGPEVAGDPASSGEPTERIKGQARLIAFRLLGAQVEQLAQDAEVHAGDVIQLRYNPAGRSHGVIASIDGAGVVTLHYPLKEDAPPEATRIAADITALPTAYALDDAPGFERFFFITSNGPLDVHAALAAVTALAHRDDSATGSLDLPSSLRQWSLRLRKPAPSPATHESP